MEKYILDVNNRQTKFEVQSNFNRLNILFNTNFIQNYLNTIHPFYLSVLIEMLIILDDLLSKIKEINRVAFKDDVPQDVKLYGDSKNDITDFVRYFRNAVCHINNDKRAVGDTINVISFCMSVGVGKLFETDEVHVGGKYEDDACLMMGDKQLYIKRHITRVYEELKLIYFAIPEFDLST